MRLTTTFKRLFRKLSIQELIAAELADASRELLTAETAVEFSASVVQYNLNRIARLRKRLIEENQRSN